MNIRQGIFSAELHICTQKLGDYMDRETVMEKAEEKKQYAGADLYGRSGSRHLLRWILFLLVIFVFCGAIVISLLPREDLAAEGCMGVSVLSEEEYARFTTYRKKDYSDYLRFKNEFVAVDLSDKAIYISQNIDESTTMQALDGKLTIDFPGKELYFAPDEAWENLAEAVSQGHRFELLVAGRGDTYMKYDVVFTTLPVLSMHGKVAYKTDSYIENFTGRLTLWDPNPINSEENGVQTSKLHWHARGGWSLYEPKKSWKLSLKGSDGDNKNEEFLGLGSDDDWILNSMSLEDSNIRDMLGMDLWNNIAATTDHNYPMSRGEYVEVLINGEYRGLYLLQRRIDDKYLELKNNAFVIKATPDKGVLEYNYFSPIDQLFPEALIKSYFEDKQMAGVECQNFVDVSLYLQLFVASDNRLEKNMYYVFEQSEDGHTVSLIPWDLDMSMGVIWSDMDDGYEYDYERSLHKFNVARMEMDMMQQQYPDLDQRLSERWKQLRQNFFTQEYIGNLIDSYEDILEKSGAVARDQEKWGLYLGGEDKVENLYVFVEERLALLDEYYQ